MDGCRLLTVGFLDCSSCLLQDKKHADMLKKQHHTNIGSVRMEAKPCVPPRSPSLVSLIPDARAVTHRLRQPQMCLVLTLSDPLRSMLAGMSWTRISA